MISRNIQDKLIEIILSEEGIKFDSFEGLVWIMSRSVFRYNIQYTFNGEVKEISGTKMRKLIRKDLINSILIYN
jgi:hypothetical protein